MSTTSTAKDTKKKANFDISAVEEGDIFSEQSHYVFNGQKNGKDYQCLHVESGRVVNLNEQYITDLLKTADQYDKEVEVGREDKLWTAKQIEDAHKGVNKPVDLRVGDLRQKGIRSIWADIHSEQVFTVNFNKQNTELSDKAVAEAKQKKVDEVIAAITKAQKNKEGVAKVAEAAIREIMDNPILPIVKGDERKLRGFKTQFESINGSYNVIDMDITKGSQQRQVNVNAINWLLFNGVKYVVK